MGRNVGDKLRGERNGEWKWRHYLKEGTPVRSENLLEVQTMARPSSFEKEHECDQSRWVPLSGTPRAQIAWPYAARHVLSRGQSQEKCSWKTKASQVPYFLLRVAVPKTSHWLPTASGQSLNSSTLWQSHQQLVWTPPTSQWTPENIL